MGRYISISAGLITITPDPTTLLDTLISEADKALYQTKHNGRDQFVQGNISLASLAVNIFKTLKPVAFNENTGTYCFRRQNRSS